MARRNFLKAYNDIVGGTGTDVSVSIGPDASRKTSVLKLSTQTKDVSLSNRQAFEIKAFQRNPIQMAQPREQDQAEVEGKGRKNDFVNIDGDAVVTKQGAQPVPETVHKMRSFMSMVELGRRENLRSSPQMKSLGRGPQANLDSNNSRIAHQPEVVKMSLPKGIDRTDQPYVVPKFMPSYRELMTTKPKGDPLVSIVEPTPPSMQKWAVEWNSEPKNISIDELKEDILRETAEKYQTTLNSTQKLPSLDESGENCSFRTHKSEMRKQDQLIKDVSTLPGRHSSDKIGSISSNAVEAARFPLHDKNADSSPVKQTASQTFDVLPTEWKPSNFSNLRRLLRGSQSQKQQYSFKDAIQHGEPVKRVASENSSGPRIPFMKPKMGTVAFDTEELKFHEWFKERMSAAVKSNLAQPSQNSSKNHNAQGKYPSSSVNVSASNDSGKQRNGVFSFDSATHNHTKGNFSQNTIPNESLEDEIAMIPPEVRKHPKPADDTVTISYKPEASSSFYHWLKVRGHHTVKPDSNSSERKGEEEKQNHSTHQAPPKFPWSVPYTSRKSVPSPKKAPKREPEVIYNSLKDSGMKIMKSYDKSETLAKNATKARNRVSVDNVSLQSVKSFEKTVAKRKSAGKKAVKSVSKKSNTSTFVKKSSNRFDNNMPREKSRVVAPAEKEFPALFGDSWNVDSEIDHVNNLRKMELYGSTPKAVRMKKMFPSMQQSPMKYWETKYDALPKLAETRKLPQSADVVSKRDTHKWSKSMPRTASDGIKSVFKDVLTARHADGDDSSNFSNIAEYSNFPLNLTPTSFKDPVMEFSEDFDIDGFLCEEEAVEKQLLQRTSEQAASAEDAKQKPEVVNSNRKPLRGKESIKFPRFIHAQPAAKNTEHSLKQIDKEAPYEDEFVRALGDDPGQTDLEWTEFIGPRNSFDQDPDLTRLLSTHARQLSSAHNTCL